ncbi:DUF2840 domain-containing protein [Gluconacetobacter entanii]|uniref:DUF2840 domain-containing protein n=1 Tax=Gluconacetobacter entanii TaxID=108528 RepID=UPI001C935368|nr:DUF2840 domain-containing protein [Gluconacetobacter entanii]MBY4639996.1 DUF2840 domain-containing protein [Gluconacetobacter entanii]MCW4581838.1 DUF2840 domain-containing protein [Gluconacetobacter entanii]MCW4585044.1 DUF2840 domain-containing protein [Gluconacetobacter entanii]MCW4588794.1 DUF2840 domain-containing protein [Gluconacetobacter entanii]
MIHSQHDTTAHVELTWVEKRIEHWIRFGRAAHEQILDRRRRILSFPPDSVFGFVRWASNDYGTVVSRLDIVRVPLPGEGCDRVPFVSPGGHLLLRVSGWPHVRKVLQVVDAIEAMGLDAATVCPDHWRHVHNRMAAGQVARPYTPERHAVWLQRRSVTS